MLADKLYADVPAGTTGVVVWYRIGAGLPERIGQVLPVAGYDEKTFDIIYAVGATGTIRVEANEGDVEDADEWYTIADGATTTSKVIEDSQTRTHIRVYAESIATAGVEIKAMLATEPGHPHR